MEIHPPHEPVRSLKDFLYHMLTVVLGILIALSLEGVQEWARHRSLANEARESLVGEIRENQARLNKGLALAPDAENRLRTAVQLAQAAQARHETPSATLDLAFGVLPLSSTNWNAAQSEGALSFMGPLEVERYTRIYVVQQNFLAIQDNTLGRWLELQKWGLFLKDGKGLSGLDEGEVAAFKQEAAAALVYLRTEEDIGRQLDVEYSHIPAAR